MLLTATVLLCVWGDVAPAVLHLRYLVHPPQTTCIDRERHSLGQSSSEVGRPGLLTFNVTHKQATWQSRNGVGPLFLQDPSLTLLSRLIPALLL